MPRLRWLLLLGLSVLLGLMLFGLPLYGKRVLTRLPGDYVITAQRVSGPIWRPTLVGATVTGPGIQAEADRLGIRVHSVNPFTRTVRFSTRLRSAELDLNLARLLAGQRRSSWTFVPAEFDVQDVRVNLDNKAYRLPDARLTASGSDGKLSVRAFTPHGGAKADITYAPIGQELAGTADVQFDAALVRAYWTGVTGGRVTGQYRFHGGDLQGDLRVHGGSIDVPQAGELRVTGITGTIQHRGAVYDLNLQGQGWNGPVAARGRVDTARRHWTASGTARPDLSEAARGFGITGSGRARVTAHAEGWTQVNVSANVTGEGVLSGVPFEQLSARYGLRRGRSVVTGSAVTLVAGEQQNLKLAWAARTGGVAASGHATWTGRLIGAPLNVRAIVTGDALRMSGTALNGRTTATYDTRRRVLHASATGTTRGARFDATAAGSLDRLQLAVRDLRAGPVTLTGTGRLSRSGVILDFGSLLVRGGPDGRGTWSAIDLPVGPASVSGTGRFDLAAGTVEGDARARVPYVQSVLSGPLRVAWNDASAAWSFGAGRVEWRDGRVSVATSGIRVADLTVAGRLTYADGDVTGRLRASGAAGTVTVTGAGRTALLDARVRGVTVRGETKLQSGFATALRLAGPDVRANVRYDAGWRFDARTGGDTIEGNFTGGRLSAAGALDLAAIRALVNVPDLTGRVVLDVRNGQGPIRVTAAGGGATASGELRVRNGSLSGALNAVYAGVSFTQRGSFLPAVATSGQVEWQGQKLAASLTGAPGRLEWRVAGRTKPIPVSGVTLPAEPIEVRGSLTPRVRAAGRWGDLRVRYAKGRLSADGRSKLVAFGQPALVRLSASLGPGWSGALHASGEAGAYMFDARGPWRAVQARVMHESLIATARVNVPRQKYTARATGVFAGYRVRASATGSPGTLSAVGTARDASGGVASFTATTPETWAAEFRSLAVQGVPVTGALRASAGVINGEVRAPDALLSVVNGTARLAGTVRDTRVEGSARWQAPLRIDNVNVTAAGAWGEARVAGTITDLRGGVTVREQRAVVAGRSLVLNAARFPVRASLSPPSLAVGDLSYANGAYAGRAFLTYAVGRERGRVTIEGSGNGVRASLSGWARGSLTVFPRVEGDVLVSASVVEDALPEAPRGAFQAGNVRLRVRGAEAHVTLVDTRYAGAPLALDASVSWADGPRARGVLLHPGSRVPFEISSAGLRIANARVDGRALRPFVRATGRLEGSVSIPDFRWAAARGAVNVQLDASGQRADGRISVLDGAVGANLTSTLGGEHITVRGVLYPRVDATVRAGDVDARLRGHVASGVSLNAAGTYAGRSVAISGTLSERAVTLHGDVSTLRLAVQATHTSAGWRVTGQAASADLRPLTGQEGTLAVAVAGTPLDLAGAASGSIAGGTFHAPVRWRASTLTVQGASVRHPTGALRLTGRVYPSLDLAGNAVVTSYAPGTYDARVTGSVDKPVVTVTGLLGGASAQDGSIRVVAPGTRVTARLAGQDWLVSAAGTALRGAARGRLDAGLLDASFDVDTSLVWPQGSQRVRGLIGWNARTGWSGRAEAHGEAYGERTSLLFLGDGSARLEGVVGGGTVTALVPGSALRAPEGSVRIAGVDIGAFWGERGHVTVAADGFLGGTWARPSVRVAGRLTDSAGELTGPVQGEVTARGGRFELTGERLQVVARLTEAEYSVDVTARQVQLARVLPRDWKVTALDLSGTFTASGGPRAVTRVTGSDVTLSVVQADTGTLTVAGDATYTPQEVRADLRGTLVREDGSGGAFTARGSLPDGVRLQAQQMDLRRYGIGVVDGDVTLTGSTVRPALAGRLSVVREDGTASVHVSGNVQDPRARVTVDLNGAVAGRVFVDVRDVAVAPPRAWVRVNGAVAHARDRLTLDLQGSWPALAGEARFSSPRLPEPVVVRGDGAGRYALSAGSAASGTVTLRNFVPVVDGSVRVTPLGILGASGQGEALVSIAGPVTAPRVAVQGAFSDVERAGIRVPAFQISGSGVLPDVRIDVTQAARKVAVYAGGRLDVTAATAEAYGARWTVTGRIDSEGTANGTVRTEGAVNGTASVSAREGELQARGAFEASAGRVTFDVAGSAANGWSGSGGVAGAPSGVLTRDARFTVGGPWSSPVLEGGAGLFGAEARFTVRSDGARVELADGPDTRADGELVVSARGLAGRIMLERSGSRANVVVSGTVSEPQVSADVKSGQWTARGTYRDRRVEGVVSDGQREGTVRFDGRVLTAALPALNLGTLGLTDLAGVITADARYDAATGTGRADVHVAHAVTPWRLPFVDVAARGTANASVTAADGALTLGASLVTPDGRVEASLRRSQTAGAAWSGSVTAALRRNGGTLGADLSVTDGMLDGEVAAVAFPGRVLGVEATLDGALRVTRNAFELSAALRGSIGRVTVSGSGNAASVLNDVIPGLAIAESDDGFRVDARLQDLSLAALEIAPHLGGRLSGTATFTDGGSTFALRSEDLRVAGELLPARVEGTSYGQEWRLRGAIGESQLLGSLTNGVVTGRVTLVALPVSSLLGAYSGSLPGRGIVTGVARFEVPVADPAAGRVDVVAERVRIAAGTEILDGSGTLRFANRELLNVSLALRGAGEWDVQGQYTRAAVDVRASLRDTTFTPILSIIPGVREQKPTLRGNVELRVAGTYDRPEGRVTGRALSGSVSDVAITVPTLDLTLVDGRLGASASLNTQGRVAARGTLNASGVLRAGALVDGRVTYDGDVATRETGRFERVAAELLQTTSGWAVDGTVRQGGVARVTGTVTPRVRLEISGRGLTPQLGFIYARESNLDADITVTERDGDYHVGGALTFNRLVVGRVSAPDGVASTPDAPRKPDERSFVSPMPQELVTFPVTAQERPALPFLSRVVFDGVPVLAPNGISVDENLVRADAIGSVVLNGRASEPLISGEFRVLRGTLFLRENEFRVTESTAVFDGAGPYPTIRLAATGTVPADGRRVTVNVTSQGSFVADGAGGRSLQLDTRFSSPDTKAGGQAFTESELYSLVAFGTLDATAIPGELLQSGVRTALNVFLIGEIERSLARAFGLDVFRIRTNLLSGERDFRVQLTFGTYLTREFYVQYQVDLTGVGLVDAIYTTPDNRFTFTVSTPLSGVDFSSARPSLSVALNLTERSSVQFGVKSGASTTFRLGYTYRF